MARAKRRRDAQHFDLRHSRTMTVRSVKGLEYSRDPKIAARHRFVLAARIIGRRSSPASQAQRSIAQAAFVDALNAATAGISSFGFLIL